MPNAAAPTEITTRDCPYRGLDHFSESDQEYFFGREEETTTIAANLLTAQLTLLYGASGVGKSSVIMAGVMPFLRRQRNTTAVLFRSWQDPLLLPALNDTVATAVRERTGIMIDTECEFDVCLASAAARTQTRLTIIFDQFEEFLLYHSRTQPGEEFDHQFARIVNHAEAGVTILISIREDWLAKLDRFQRHVPDLLGNLVRLEPLGCDGARNAIKRPLDRFNYEMRLLNSDAPLYTIETELIGVVLEQARTNSMTRLGEDINSFDEPDNSESNGEIETPFLQMILSDLWTAELAQGSRQLRLETLRDLGGASRIIRSYVDNAVDNLTQRQQEICAMIFDRLVTPSGSKIAYSAQDLVELTGQDSFEVRGILGALAGSKRLLREVVSPGAVRFEIFHDILAQPILDWRMRYVTAKRARELERDRVHSARRRRLWLFGVFAVILTVVFLGIRWRQFAATLRRAETQAVAEEKAAQTRQVEALLSNGRRRASEGAYSNAISSFREAELAARRIHDKRLLADSLLRRANCEVLLDNDEEARETTAELNRISARSDVLSANSWASLGLLELALGDSRQAMNALQRALLEASRIKNDRVVADVLLTIGNIQYTHGDFAEARTSYERADGYARRTKAYEIEVKSVAQLVKVAKALGDDNAKLEYADELDRLLGRSPERIRSLLKTNVANSAGDQ